MSANIAVQNKAHSKKTSEIQICDIILVHEYKYIKWASSRLQPCATAAIHVSFNHSSNFGARGPKIK